jgi:hypothetical protein
MKASGPAVEFREIDRRDGGVGWMAYPDETMQRASHAVAVDGDVWVCDPVDVEGLDDLLAEYGDVAGVVILLDRHKRDSAAVANRHDVPVYVPEWMDGVGRDVDAPTERVRVELTDSNIGVHRLVDNRFWQEACLLVEDRGELVVPESVGTASYFLSGDERLGVHPMLRLLPPKRLAGFTVDRVLVGHGAGVHEDATAALQDAIAGSRRRTPRLYGSIVKNAVVG